MECRFPRTANWADKVGAWGRENAWKKTGTTFKKVLKGMSLELQFTSNGLSLKGCEWRKVIILGNDMIMSVFVKKTVQTETGQDWKRRPSGRNKYGKSILGQFYFPNNHVVIFMASHGLNFKLWIPDVGSFSLPGKVFTFIFPNYLKNMHCISSDSGLYC